MLAFPLFKRSPICFFYPWIIATGIFSLTACGGGSSSTTSTTGANEPVPSGLSSADSSSDDAMEEGAFVVIDQFGYQPTAEKIAIIRDPQEGFDADNSFSPSNTFEVVNADTNAIVMTGEPIPWNNSATDDSSGDKVWWFDFSSVQSAGNYFVRDAGNGTRSYTFAINNDVYDEVLKQTARAFFYQRAGFAKQAPYAEQGWIDDASHMGPRQDANARLYNDPDNADTERDLSGGWYDAGDYNKYTNWTADYVIGLLHAYEENPAAWGDDFDIPESYNGVPDILDEVKWGLDSLVRMQDVDGSVLSIVGLDHASPPSSATGPSYYGPASTSATLTTAAAFAYGSKVFATLDNATLISYANDLSTRAKQAWAWADANPSVTFHNNDPTQGSEGLGAGQQEVDDNERLMKKLSAAAYLYDLTGEAPYKTFFESNYTQAELIQATFASAFRGNLIRDLLYYASLAGVTQSVADNIQTKFVTAMNGFNGWPAVNNASDPYRAFLADYTWGSSSIKASKGSLFYELILHNLGDQDTQTISNTALGYIHYLHGVNPLAKTYLSNMGAHGAENSVSEFYHSWFTNGSAYWDSTENSTYGPAPGFVIGGTNPSYNWDSCCPYSCGSQANNNVCGIAPPSPPFDQPEQKSYSDFNTSWPLNSWQVTENSNAYQTNYLRLLSKFVNNN